MRFSPNKSLPSVYFIDTIEQATAIERWASGSWRSYMMSLAGMLLCIGGGWYLGYVWLGVGLAVGVGGSIMSGATGGAESLALELKLRRDVTAG